MADIKDKIDFNNLVYIYSDSNKNYPKDFRNNQKPQKLFEDFRDGKVNPKEVLKCQESFKSDLREIRTGGNKSTNQKTTIENLNNFFDLPEKVINFFRDYSFWLSKAKYKTKYGEGLKILTPKQMLQRLPLAPAQVKAGNNSNVY